jgi:3-hydroxyisobutyrate dehydrogenase
VAEEAFRLAALVGVPADRETYNAREVQARNGVKDLALAEALAHSLDTPSAAASFAKGQYYHAYTANLPQARPASNQNPPR